MTTSDPIIPIINSFFTSIKRLYILNLPDKIFFSRFRLELPFQKRLVNIFVIAYFSDGNDNKRLMVFININKFFYFFLIKLAHLP